MKYALTSGVLSIEIDDKQLTSLESKGYFSIPGNYNLVRIGEVANTINEAERMFEEKKIKKLQSLDKQVKKYSALKFKVK